TSTNPQTQNGLMNSLHLHALTAAADTQTDDTQGIACLGIVLLVLAGWRLSAGTRFEVKELVGKLLFLAALAAVAYGFFFVWLPAGH
ncbi:MAG: hypothetical protein ACRD0P_16065, partial [Stackebrandtia sp.]